MANNCPYTPIARRNTVSVLSECYHHRKWILVASKRYTATGDYSVAFGLCCDSRGGILRLEVYNVVDTQNTNTKLERPHWTLFVFRDNVYI